MAREMINNTETCDWREEDGLWRTDCNGEFMISEGTPKENGMEFCCYCGKRVKEFPEEGQEC